MVLVTGCFPWLTSFSSLDIGCGCSNGLIDIFVGSCFRDLGSSISCSGSRVASNVSSCSWSNVSLLSSSGVNWAAWSNIGRWDWSTSTHNVFSLSWTWTILGLSSSDILSCCSSSDILSLSSSYVMSLSSSNIFSSSGIGCSLNITCVDGLLPFSFKGLIWIMNDLSKLFKKYLSTGMYSYLTCLTGTWTYSILFSGTYWGMYCLKYSTA